MGLFRKAAVWACGVVGGGVVAAWGGGGNASSPDGVVIPVCWEANTDPFVPERTMARDAVMSAWANSRTNIHLTGWGPCAPGAPGLHVGHFDDRPRVEAIGSSLNGIDNGVRLNFSFATWAEAGGCRTDGEEVRRICIRHYAIHEFGHALGLLHEFDRADFPGCRYVRAADRTELRPSDVLVGNYDPRSVMNYCSNFAQNPSEGDMAVIRQLYGTPSAPQRTGVPAAQPSPTGAGPHTSPGNPDEEEDIESPAEERGDDES